MRRPALYSSSRPGKSGQDPAPAPTLEQAPPVQAQPRFSLSSPRLLWGAILVLAALLVFSLSLGLRPAQRKLTQDDINAAVLKTMETQVMPSEYARAYENIRPSVVRVISYVKKSRLKDDKEGPRAHSGAKPKPLGPANGDDSDARDDEVEHGVGTGVVIIDKGVILTNLHVVSGADRISVVFSDGLQSVASITGVQAGKCAPLAKLPHGLSVGHDHALRASGGAGGEQDVTRLRRPDRFAAPRCVGRLD